METKAHNFTKAAHTLHVYTRFVQNGCATIFECVSLIQNIVCRKIREVDEVMKTCGGE